MSTHDVDEDNEEYELARTDTEKWTELNSLCLFIQCRYRGIFEELFLQRHVDGWRAWTDNHKKVIKTKEAGRLRNGEISENTVNLTLQNEHPLYDVQRTGPVRFYDESTLPPRNVLL